MRKITTMPTLILSFGNANKYLNTKNKKAAKANGHNQLFSSFAQNIFLSVLKTCIVTVRQKVAYNGLGLAEVGVIEFRPPRLTAAE
jgi:hypothetical protein